MPTTGTNARLLLTARITAVGTAATVGLAFTVMEKTVLQKVRSISTHLSNTLQIYPNISSI